MARAKNLFCKLLYVVGCMLANYMNAQHTIQVQNTLDFPRNEIVGIPASQLKTFLKKNKETDLRIKDSKNNIVVTQWIDNNGDRKNDELLFQVNIEANSTNSYSIISDAKTPVPENKISTFSRFVPESGDDYAWENDKIAFRMYGPKRQKEAVEGIKEGVLSSGVDIWFKKTSQPVINKWYKGYLTDPLYYQKDTRGEGYDPYYIGNSRGTGGIGIWANGNLQVSKNYVTFKTLAEGPLRTLFELTYNSWSDFAVKETKRISLDLGSDFSKFESRFETKSQVPNYTIGISLHENEGITRLNDRKGYFLHWEKIDGTHVGEGIILNPNIVQKSFAHQSEIPDQSNLLILTIPQKTLTYYAGFAWQKSGQVQKLEDWEALLQKQTRIIANPLMVELK